MLPTLSHRVSLLARAGSAQPLPLHHRGLQQHAEACAYAFLTGDADPRLLERAAECLAALAEQQGDSGLFRSGDNVESPPDSSFTVNGLAGGGGGGGGGPPPPPPTTGLKTMDEQRLAFRVRPDFTARVECTRTNPDAGCLPFKPIEVRFTSPVPRAQALGLWLKADAKVFEPEAFDKDPVPRLALLFSIASMRSRGDTPKASRRAGSGATRYCRSWPPITLTSVTPGTLDNWGRTIQSITFLRSPPS